jgi:hypothetical protein
MGQGGSAAPVDDGRGHRPELETMVIMDDETDDLLDAFLAVASGERTAKTRERYQRTLAHLRTPVEGEIGCGPGARLLLRVAHQLPRADTERLAPDEYDTMPSLYERLVTWLRRHTDAGGPGHECARLETLAVLRDVRRERWRERYSALRDVALDLPAAPSELDDLSPVTESWWQESVYPSNLYAFPRRE